MKRRSADQPGHDAKRMRPEVTQPVEGDNGESGTATSGSSDDANPELEGAVAEEAHVPAEPPKVPPAAHPQRAQSPEWVVSPSGQHLSEAFIERLRNFLSFTDPETARFYITNVPGNLQWGKGDLDRFLCTAGKPVLFWFVCELSSEFFLCAPGCNPAKSISANVSMLREGDRVAARRLLRDNQRYTGPDNAPDDTIRLSCKTSAFTRTKQTRTWLFEDIYDGRHDFGPKNSLERMLPDKVGTGDIFLAECFLTRYRCDAEGKPSYERTTTWARYRTGFEIKCLTLLRTGEELETVTLPAVDDSKTARM